MSEHFIINPAIDAILRAADKAELHCIRSFIDQLLDDRRLSEVLARNGIERGSEQVLDLTIDDIDISVAVYNILKAAKIHTLGDVLEYGIGDLVRLRGLGKSRLEQLAIEMEKRGLTLK